VLAWIVGQWNTIYLGTELAGHDVETLVAVDGVRFNCTRNPPSLGERFTFRTLPYTTIASWTSGAVLTIPGLVFFCTSGVKAVLIFHWLVATLFGLFNIFLHWFYGKRPEVQPCEN
jgi:hypothetical protein